MRKIVGGVVRHRDNVAKIKIANFSSVVSVILENLWSRKFPAMRYESVIIMYYIASLATFGNRCSTVFARRQDQWEDNNYSLSFQRMQTKSYALCFTTYFRTWCSISAYYSIFGYRKLPALACLICCTDDLTQLLPCIDLWRLRTEIVSVREYFYFSQFFNLHIYPRCSNVYLKISDVKSNTVDEKVLQFRYFSHNTVSVEIIFEQNYYNFQTLCYSSDSESPGFKSQLDPGIIFCGFISHSI